MADQRNRNEYFREYNQRKKEELKEKRRQRRIIYNAREDSEKDAREIKRKAILKIQQRNYYQKNRERLIALAKAYRLKIKEKKNEA